MCGSCYERVKSCPVCRGKMMGRCTDFEKFLENNANDIWQPLYLKCIYRFSQFEDHIFIYFVYSINKPFLFIIYVVSINLFFKISTEINYSNSFPINSEIATVTKWSDLHPGPRCVEDVMIEAEVSRTTQDPASAALISVSVLRHGQDTVDRGHF